VVTVDDFVTGGKRGDLIHGYDLVQIALTRSVPAALIAQACRDGFRQSPACGQRAVRCGANFLRVISR
jgi:hypothetical protein